MWSLIKQCQIHGSPVADGWAGAVVQKPLVIQKGYRTDGPTYRPTRQGVVACPRLKKLRKVIIGWSRLKILIFGWSRLQIVIHIYNSCDSWKWSFDDPYYQSDHWMIMAHESDNWMIKILVNIIGWSRLLVVIIGWSRLPTVNGRWSRHNTVIIGWSRLLMVIIGRTRLMMVIFGWSILKAQSLDDQYWDHNHRMIKTLAHYHWMLKTPDHNHWMIKSPNHSHWMMMDS